MLVGSQSHTQLYGSYGQQTTTTQLYRCSADSHCRAELAVQVAEAGIPTRSWGNDMAKQVDIALHNLTQPAAFPVTVRALLLRLLPWAAAGVACRELCWVLLPLLTLS